jgi:hypothetical protein
MSEENFEITEMGKEYRRKEGRNKGTKGIM